MVVPAISPHSPTIASHGLMTTYGRGSTVRAPDTSFRVKHARRLLKCWRSASERSRSVNSLHTAIDARASSGLSMRLHHPTRCVSALRGMRLVSRKLIRSCWDSSRSAVVMPTRDVSCRNGCGGRHDLVVRGKKAKVLHKATHDRSGLVI